MVQSRIAELSSLIAAQTAIINSYLASKDMPSPSFGPDQPVNLLSDVVIAAPRQAILEATDELNALMQGPIGILTSPPHNFMISLQAICHFNLASKVSARGGHATFKEISLGTGLNESTVRRLLRHAMSYRIFHETENGTVAHTGASKYLAEKADMRSWIGMVSEEMWPAATKTVESLEKWPHSEEPHHSGFNLAHGTTKPSFEAISSLPDREQRYAEAMRWFSAGPGLEASHVLDGFDWAGLGKATVVDIGGSYGSVSIAIAQKFPNVSCIVQDRKDVAEAGHKMLPVSLERRVSFMGHNFFDPQPVKAAAVYLLRWVLHDWPDVYAIRILRALLPALTDDSRIVICELVLPQPGSGSILHDRNARSFDLAMLEFHNGKERGLDDWKELFNIVDPRLEIVRVN